MEIGALAAANLLKSKDNILILVHSHPDGDTLGCGFSLAMALMSFGKNVMLKCEDTIPAKFNYMFNNLQFKSFNPDFIVAVDVADTKLLGKIFEEKYFNKIDLCIDHHPSNKMFASKTLLDGSAAAASEIIFTVLQKMKAEITCEIANCLYTGISTDTGCFRYANVTPRTLRMAADLIDYGADNYMINTVMFETKTKSYVLLERMCLDSIEMYFDDRCAIITITKDMFSKSGSDESECDGIAALPRQIEGVLVGVTIREKADGTYKASMRSNKSINVSDICKKMGGGGHAAAAGCQFDSSLDEAKKEMLKYIGEALKNI